MWLERLKELKKEKHLSAKQIAQKANMSERTVTRIFSGDTTEPYVDTLPRIAAALDVSLEDILGDSKAVVSNVNVTAVQEEVKLLTAELEAITAENVMLKDKVVTLSTEIGVLTTRLEHKEEIIALHNHYASMIGTKKARRPDQAEKKMRKKITTSKRTSLQ